MDSKIKDTLIQIFNGMSAVLNIKNVIGDPIYIGDTTIIPLVEISSGMGVGEFKEKDAGGMATKATPVAVIVVRDGMTKILNIKNQDPITKVLELFPDLINKISGKEIINKEVKQKANDLDVEFYNIDENGNKIK